MKRENRTWRFSVIAMAAAMALGLWSARPARGEDTDGITVIGTGTAQTRPSVAQIDATVSADGELASDAKVQFQDARSKVMAAIDALKNPDVAVKSDGPSVSQAVDPNQQMQMMRGMAAPAGGVKAHVMITEALHVELKGIDKLPPDQVLASLFKLIDTGRDSGLQIGQTPSNYYQMQIQAQMGSGQNLVMFKIPDKAVLKSEACEQAIADARRNAEQIAHFSGVKLGRILSVQEQGADTSAQQMNPYYYMGMMANQGQTDNKAVLAAALGDVPLTVSLTVKFEIIKDAP